ncbi:MAG: hypothetical protein HWE30_13890 [Methylocystaceae bacterium]|nr:hypothetical protein [Methylocystaceae bacterium]
MIDMQTAASALDLLVVQSIGIAAFKITCLLSGTLIVFMGYKLFVFGKWGESGDIQGEYKNIKLIIRRAAPGTLFALFGAIIICWTVFEGINYNFTSYSSEVENEKPVLDE